MLTPQLYTLFLVSLVHQAVTLTRQPYGALMCKDLGLSLTNKTDQVKFDPLHLKCRIVVPVPVPAPAPAPAPVPVTSIKLTCVMCKKIINMKVANQQICQTVNDHYICTFISKNEACLFTKKRTTSDKLYFDSNEATTWVNVKGIGLFCAPELQSYVETRRLKTGSTMTIDICYKGRVYLPEQKDIWRGKDNCTTSIIGDIENNNWKSVRQLLQEMGESINCIGIRVYVKVTPLFKFERRLMVTPLFQALKLQSHDVFYNLLGLGADLSMTNSSLYTVLHTACAVVPDTLNVVKRLVALGLDIEQRTLDGFTPFLLAVDYHKIEIMKYLISMGCKVDVVTGIKQNALHLAAMRGNAETVDYLLKYKHIISLHSKDKKGRNPLFYAQRKDPNIARKIEAQMTT